ncbi:MULTISPECIES: DUF2062 domain-containing protein [Aerosakkonema]|uniref:DUF2062 domain-containing protein n=1 Tax=Aerosakkonema TaxID=1246629 RepID=UPI0035B9324E
MSKQSEQSLLTLPTKSISIRHRKSKRLASRWRRSLHYFYLRFLRLRGSPESIARGLAAGVFAGLFPLIATQMAVAILIAALIRGNKIVAAAATWISNPFTAVPLYTFAFQVGRSLLGSDLSFASESLDSWHDMMQLGTEFVTDLLVGCFVVASVSAVASYFLGLWLIRRVRTKRKSRQLS